MTEPLLHPHRGLFEDEMRRIREVVLGMGDLVDGAISRATLGLVSRDVGLCTGVIHDDARINAMQAEARELSFTTILTQAPVARDLREIMGFLHMASELERMADHCVNIARIGRDLADLPPLKPYVDVPRLADACAEQVRDILSALVARDVERARNVAARDDLVNRIYHRLFDDLIQLMMDDRDNVYRATHLVMVAQNYERIGDRVTNLAEDLVFLETGKIEDLG